MKLWENNIRKVVPYVAGEQPKNKNVIKLNTNENPYGPSKEVEDTLVNLSDLRLYPDAKAEDLCNALAKYHGIGTDQIFVGVGSDDVLGMSFLTFFNSDKPIIFPDITYSFYDVWADLYKIPYKMAPLDDEFNIINEDYYGENGGVIFPNPNAPTALYKDLDSVEDIIKRNQDVVVIVDEAYIDFGGKSALELIDKYENLLVVRTFSKSRSMAGLRIGYAMGNAELIKALNDVKYSYNSYTMNLPSIVLGTKSVGDEEYFRKTVDKIIATRERFEEEISKLGFTYPKSSANFVFVTHNTLKAKDIFETAKERGIFLRYWDKPRINNYLRITIGTDEEMDEVIKLFKEMVE